MKNIFPQVKPIDFIPTDLLVWKWQYPESRIGETVTIGGEEVKKMLTLDINIPEQGFADSVNNATLNAVKGVFSKEYPCVHACPGCFNDATVKNPIMYWNEVKDIIEQAIELGLESVKFLGPGELTTNPKLFEILDYFQEKKIVVGMFTKAALLGSDFLTQKYHKMSSQEFVDKLVKYDNITFLVGGRSFDPKLENKFVPTKNRDERESFDYHQSRNIALERLCSAGLHLNPEKRRIAIITSPVGPETIDGVFEIFKWGIERNIPVFVTTSMVSGKGHRMVKRHQQKPFERKYEQLAIDIYQHLMKSNVVLKEQIKYEGISPYVGVAPCNQLTHGLYIHYDGEVWRCPGNDTSEFMVHPNVRDQSLLEIWKNSRNYRLHSFNNGCVKDGITIPSGFYKKVAQRL